MIAPTWLLLLLMGLVAANIYIAVGTLGNATVDATLVLPFVSWTRLALAIVWIVLLCSLIIGVLRGLRAAFAAIAPLLTLYALIGLLWNAIFAQSTYSRGSQPFDVLLTVIVLAPVWWVALRRHWLRRLAAASG